MTGRFNETGQCVGTDTSFTCAECETDFIVFWDSFAGTKLVETPCTCGKNTTTPPKKKKTVKK